MGGKEWNGAESVNDTYAMKYGTVIMLTLKNADVYKLCIGPYRAQLGSTSKFLLCSPSSAQASIRSCNFKRRIYARARVITVTSVVLVTDTYQAATMMEGVRQHSTSVRATYHRGNSDTLDLLNPSLII